VHEHCLRPAWLEIDLDKLAYNIAQIRTLVGEKVRIMAVVKDNAYGLGIAGLLETLLESGASYLGVGILDEALQIRRLAPAIPILVLGYTPFEHSHLLVRYDLRQTVYSWEQARAISDAAVKLGKKAAVHIELDTGMGRLGFPPSKRTLREIRKIAALPRLEIEGIFTHCPYTNERTPEGIRFTRAQFRSFRRCLHRLEKKGIAIPLPHVCNSLGTVYYPEMHLAMVRAGIILYGSYPAFQAALPLKPVLSLKTRIGSLKTLGPGENVGYGRTFTTQRKTRVAVLPLGYGDGISRLLNNKGEVLVRGRRAPMIGSICMDHCMIDLTDLGCECTVGEEVVIIGRQGEEEITLEEMAEKAYGYINYEFMVQLNRRLPRVYLKNGRVVKVVNYLLDPA
jgi:alanine racemase